MPIVVLKSPLFAPPWCLNSSCNHHNHSCLLSIRFYVNRCLLSCFLAASLISELFCQCSWHFSLRHSHISYSLSTWFLPHLRSPSHLLAFAPHSPGSFPPSLEVSHVGEIIAHHRSVVTEQTRGCEGQHRQYSKKYCNVPGGCWKYRGEHLGKRMIVWLLRCMPETNTK